MDIVAFAVYDPKVPAKNEKLRASDPKPLIRLLTQASRHISPGIASHGFVALAMLTTMKNHDILKSQDAVKTFVGHLRHKDLSVRADGLRSMFG